MGSRAGAWAGDATQTYTGIAITPAVAPYSVIGNTVVQSNTSPTTGFTFIGIRVNGNAGASTGATYSYNRVLSYGTLTTSSGLFGNSTGTLDYANVLNNIFQGLNAALINFQRQMVFLKMLLLKFYYPLKLRKWKKHLEAWALISR